MLSCLNSRLEHTPKFGDGVGIGRSNCFHHTPPREHGALAMSKKKTGGPNSVGLLLKDFAV